MQLQSKGLQQLYLYKILVYDRSKSKKAAGRLRF